MFRRLFRRVEIRKPVERNRIITISNEEVKKMKEKVTMECLNPQGKLDIPEPEGLSNPRVTDWKGIKPMINERKR